MRTQIRSYLALALVLLLMLTSQSMAVARGTPGPAGQMVLCTGAGLVTVYTDEDGQPVGAPHICPDAVPGFLVVLDQPDPVVGFAPLVGPAHRHRLVLQTPSVGPLLFRARAPPVPV